MSASRQRGTSYESSLLPALRTVWPHAERRGLQGAHDKGDFVTAPWLVVEAKNVAKMSLSTWLKEAEVEKVNAKADIGVVVHKKRGNASPFDQYVTMTVADFLWLAGHVTPE